MVDVARRSRDDLIFDLVSKWQDASRENFVNLEAYSLATEMLAAEPDAAPERRRKLMLEMAAAERRADAAHDRLGELTQLILLHTPESLRGAARLLEVIRQEHCAEPDMALVRYALKGVIELLDRQGG